MNRFLTSWARTAMTLLALFLFLGGARAQQALPYEYGFENNDLSADGWVLQGKTSNNTSILSNAARTDSYGFRISYIEQDFYLLSPILTGGDTGVEVSFWYKEYSSAYGDEQFQVGYTTDETVTDASAFTYGDVVTASTSWQEYTNIFPAGTKRIAIKYIYNNTFYLYLDDFSFAVGVAPTCVKPTGVSVSNVTNESAEISWTSAADTWNLQYRIVGESNWTEVKGINKGPSYPLDGLDSGTTYEVQVQADCGGGDTSNWTNSVEFTTSFCAPSDQCIVNITLTDAYGDGGGKIEVVDVLTNMVLGTFTNTTASTSYTLNVCKDREINFIFTSTDSYAYENGYMITDVNDEVIAEHEGCASSSNCTAPSNGIIATYTVDCSNCKRPKNLVASEITATSVKLTWEGTASDWVIGYVADDPNEEYDLVKNVTDNTYTITGLDPETLYYVAVRPSCDMNKWCDQVSFTTLAKYPAPSNVAVSNVTTTSATISWTGEAGNYNLRYKETTPPSVATIILTAGDVWNDGSGYQMLIDADANAYGTVFDATGGWTAADYSDFEYLIPTDADCSADATNFVFNNSVSIQIPAGTYDWCIVNPSPGDKIYIAANNGDIPARQDDYVFEAGKTYEFTMQLAGNGDGVFVNITDAAPSRMLAPAFDTWVTVKNVSSPYTIEDLNEAAYYEVEVQGVYTDGTSAWAGTGFTTLSSNPIPTGVAVTPSHTTATISWTASSDSYEVKYRTAETESAPVFFEDFESGIGSWTTSNLESGGGVSSGVGTENSTGFRFKWTTNTPQYLISPELSGVVAGNTLKFYYANYNASYPESFKVGYSTTGNDIDNDFTWSAETTAPANTSWHLYELALPAGTKYFAIQCTSYDMYYLYVDDFGIYGDNIPAGAWTTVSTNDTSVEITGLEMDTEYEYQIFGIKGGIPNEGTSIKSFTTLSAENDKIFTTAGDWDVAANWYPTGVPSATCKNATIKAAVTIPSGVVATAKNITIDGGSITIKDGGQLIHNNDGVIATVEKNIAGYGTSTTGKYYLITAPLKDGINPADVTNMLTGNYDLYSFDFTEDGAEWRNYKAESFTMARGNAFLYANSADVTLSFTGELIPMPATGYIAYVTGNYANYTTAAHPFQNFNLVGNPLAGDAYVTLGTYNSGIGLASNPKFYTINAAGDAFEPASDDATAVMGGTFVISQASNSIVIVGAGHYIDNTATDNPLMALPLHGETTHQSALVTIALGNDATDNKAKIDAINGKACNIQLTGRTLYKDDSWNTLCLPFDVTIAGSPLDGATAKTLSNASVSGSSVSLTFGNEVTTLQANTPYIIKWDAASAIVEPTFTNVTIVNADEAARTVSMASDAVKFVGYYDAFDVAANNQNIYYMTADNKLKYTTVDRTLKSLRAYFDFSGVPTSAREFILDFGDGTITTSIDQIEDGRLKMDDSVYDLQGRKVDMQNGQLKKGIYIVNGQKKVVRSEGLTR